MKEENNSYSQFNLSPAFSNFFLLSFDHSFDWIFFFFVFLKKYLPKISVSLQQQKRVSLQRETRSLICCRLMKTAVAVDYGIMRLAPCTRPLWHWRARAATRHDDGATRMAATSQSGSLQVFFLLNSCKRGGCH